MYSRASTFLTGPRFRGYNQESRLGAIQRWRNTVEVWLQRNMKNENEVKADEHELMLNFVPRRAVTH